MKHLHFTRIIIASLAFAVGLYITLSGGGYFQMDGDFGAAQAALGGEEMSARDWTLVALVVPYVASIVGAWFGWPKARGWLTFCILASLLCMDKSVSHPVEALLETVFSLLEGALLVMLWTSPEHGLASQRREQAQPAPIQKVPA